MTDAPLLLAFSAGMIATINPCGFAMLPAYLSYFLGQEDQSDDARRGVLRALAVGATVSAGFLVVFGLIGIMITKFSVSMSSISAQLPWVTIVIGLGLAGLGLAMVRGYAPTVRLPKMSRGTGSRELPSMFLFGVSYAVSSLSCTIPLFLALVANTFTAKDFGSGLVTFLAYALGMSLVLMALTLAIALARQSLVHSMRRALPYVNRVSGALLMVAGLFLAYYGWYERQVLEGGGDPGGPASAAYKWNNELINWVNQSDPRRIGLLLAAGIALSVVVATAWRSGGRATDRSR